MDSVLHQYLSMVPLRAFQWSMTTESISEDLQKTIIDQVVKHPLAKTFPPSSSYRQAFLKHLMNQAEAASIPVADEMYEAYSDAVSLPSSEVCFKSYYIGSGKFVTLKESTCMVSGGTTGLITWQAALHFIEWAITNKERTSLFSGKRILELGSGIGLAGIVLCLMSYPSEFHFTDCHSKVLETLKENIKLNLDPSCEKCNTAVHLLDWSSGTVPEDHYDIIIATDVVYDPQIVSTFVKMLTRLLRHSSVAYITSTIRNTDTYQDFCSKLDCAGLQRRVVEGPIGNTFYYDRTEPIEILEICT